MKGGDRRNKCVVMVLATILHQTKEGGGKWNSDRIS
jgi:hypothetical protein